MLAIYVYNMVILSDLETVTLLEVRSVHLENWRHQN